MDGDLEARGELQQAPDPSGERPSVPVVEEPSGVEEEREVAVGELRRLRGLLRRDEPGAPRREGLRVEITRAGVIGRRARPLDAGLAIEPRVREAGEEAWARSAVSCMKRSCTTRNSSWPIAFSAWWRSGSESSGFSPTTYRARVAPSRHPSIISVTTRPGRAGGLTPQRVSNFASVAGSYCWSPGRFVGMHPASPHPWTLFWPRRGEMPLPGKPIWPATSDRFRTAWALWMPFVCCVMSMPQIRHEPANGGPAYH